MRNNELKSNKVPPVCPACKVEMDIFVEDIKFEEGYYCVNRECSFCGIPRLHFPWEE